MDRAAIIKALRDTAQSASNAVATNVSGPVDLLAAGLRKIGVPVPQNALGGSQWMADQGLTREVAMGAPRIIGETLGMAGPAVLAGKAPQIAGAMNRGMDNLAAPRTLNNQAGAILVGPRSEALDAAQRNAVEMLGLPPNNTPMDRAKAMGFDTPAYHASDADILAFDSSKLGKNTSFNTGGDRVAVRSAKRGHWFSDRDLTNKDPRGYMFGDVSYPVLLKDPKKVKDVEFQSTSYIQKDPALIRSRFAAFDPARIKEADLLGMADPRLLGLLGIGVGGGSYLAGDK